MDFINENENFFRTPNTNNLKNKRAAFSSAKNTAKKVLTDVANTIDKRRTEFEDVAFAGKSCLGVEEAREIYKSPKRLTAGKNELKNEVADADDLLFTSCRCSSDVNVLDDFWKLPEELSLTKEDINICATRWCDDFEIGNKDIIASSPFKFDSNVFDDCTPVKIRNSVSFQELLNESFEVIPPELPF